MSVPIPPVPLEGSLAYVLPRYTRTFFRLAPWACHTTIAPGDGLVCGVGVYRSARGNFSHPLYLGLMEWPVIQTVQDGDSVAVTTQSLDSWYIAAGANPNRLLILEDLREIESELR